MSRAKLLALCRRLPHATEDVKWKKDLVFSVGDKMFACLNAEEGDGISFKTSPTTFERLTQQPGIIPAPYAARFHWVLVTSAKALPLDMLQELIQESHRLVMEKLPAKTRRKLEGDTTAKPSGKSKR